MNDLPREALSLQYGRTLTRAVQRCGEHIYLMVIELRQRTWVSGAQEHGDGLRDAKRDQFFSGGNQIDRRWRRTHFLCRLVASICADNTQTCAMGRSFAPTPWPSARAR